MNCAFYRLPKVFFCDNRYSAVTTDAKVLYAMLLDRAELSMRSGMCDEKGDIYLYFTVEQACSLLHFGRTKVMKLFGELEENGLVERRRQGRGKASIIYPIKFEGYHVPKTDLLKCAEKTSGGIKNDIQEVLKADTINTEYNHTEISDTSQSYMESDWEEIRERIKEQIEYDILSERREYSKLDEILSIMTEVMCIQSPTVQIGKTEYPAAFVKHRFSQLDAGHMEYIHDRMEWTTARIKNIKAYLLKALFDAPATMEHYYQAEVKADLGY